MSNKGGMRKKGSSNRLILHHMLRPNPSSGLKPLVKAMNSLDQYDNVGPDVRRCDVKHKKTKLKCIVPYYVEEHSTHQARNPKAHDSWITWPNHG